MINWVEKNASSKDVHLLDVGCGNGHLLLELVKKDFFKPSSLKFLCISSFLSIPPQFLIDLFKIFCIFVGRARFY